MSLIDNIKANEGFSEYVYRDSLGFLTVGYGFKCDSLTSDELELNKNRYEPMSKEVACKILELKLQKLQNEVFAKLKWLKSQPKQVQSIVIEMAYQMGVSGMLGFKNTLKLIENKEYLKASNNMLKSKWAKQTPNRAKKLSDILRSA